LPTFSKSDLTQKDCYPERVKWLEETIRCLKKGVTQAMHPKMSQQTRQEVLHKLRGRYARAGLPHKSVLIDQVVELFGYHRKAAIRALRTAEPPATRGPVILGRPRVYQPSQLLEPLKAIWFAANQPCGKLLAPAMALWVPAYESFHHALSTEVRAQLLEASAATLDRLLAPARAQGNKARAVTRPGTLLRQQIPVRGGIWEENKPGFLELDTVALCGGRLDDQHAWALNSTDICTSWFAARAIENRGEVATLRQIEDIEAHLPFPILGADSDNGGEFLNWHLLRYWQERKRPVQVSRSRAYHKNDNAHIEQKNYTRVRQWLGYDRYDNPEVVPLINELCRGPLSQLLNYFCPTMKLKEKRREGSQTARVYEPAQTPLERLLATGQLKSQEQKRLRAAAAELNPFALREQIDRQLTQIEKLRQQPRR